MGRKFQKRNEAFVCDNCQRNVPPSSSTCRNHCPYCLTSRHVDIFPGDRMNECRGLMRAVAYELTAKKGLVLIFCCQRCGAEGRNIAALEDENQSDDYDLILRLGGANVRD